LKFRVTCKSLLLQKALEEFLKDYISNDGLVISDEKGDIIIGKDIKKPFSKSQLLLQLEKIYKEKNSIKKLEKIDEYLDIFDELIEEENKSISFDEKVDILIDEFKEKLKNLIKEEYGKK